MINKKLLSFDRAALRYVGANVAFQWLGLVCNIIFVRAVARLVGAAFAGSLTAAALRQNILLCLGTVPLRFAFTMLASGMSDQASRDVKRTLRSKIYEKLTRLGPGYTATVATSEVVMLASEGVEQIDTYFAKYLPQLFYSLLAPVTLFALLVGVHARSAVILLCCVPLIPMSIVAVQKFAKKLLASYWSEYTTLGDSFLENIQGLTTLKIYQADGWKHEQMNAEAERFRKITMRVLTMQLNSVTLMDLMAYGGAGLGIISAVAAFAAGQLEPDRHLDHFAAGSRLFPAAAAAGQLLSHCHERCSFSRENFPSAGGRRAAGRRTERPGGYHTGAGRCDLWLRGKPHRAAGRLLYRAAGQLCLVGGRFRQRQKHHCRPADGALHRIYRPGDHGRRAGTAVAAGCAAAHADCCAP